MEMGNVFEEALKGVEIGADVPAPETNNEDIINEIVNNAAAPIDSATTVVGDTVSGRSGADLETANYAVQGSAIIKGMSDAIKKSREERSRSTHWKLTLLMKEPLRDDNGNILPNQSIPKKALGFVFDVDGEGEKILPKDNLIAYVRSEAGPILGDPTTGEPCLRLTHKKSRPKKVNGILQPQAPNFNFVSLNKEHKLTKWVEDFDCVDFIKEPKLDENGEFIRRKKPNSPAQVVGHPDYDPAIYKPETYIVYDYKMKYKPYFQKKRVSKKDKNTAQTAFEILMAYSAEQGLLEL